jgi:hypothetical protein
LKVKQGQVVHEFKRSTLRTQNKPLKNQPQFKQPPNVLQIHNKMEELNLPQVLRAQVNMMIPPPLYYEEYYE